MAEGVRAVPVVVACALAELTERALRDGLEPAVRAVVAVVADALDATVSVELDGGPSAPADGGPEVVVEGPSRKDPAVLTGRTRQHKLVHFPSGAPLPGGTFAEVTVTGAAPHHLTGELVAVTARPRHRTRSRIPVAAGAWT